MLEDGRPSPRTYADLILDLDRQPLVGDEADVFSLVVVGDGNVATVGDEVDNLDDAEVVTLDREGQVEHAVNVVVEHPDERLVVFGVDRFEIVVVDPLAEHVLVDGCGQTAKGQRGGGASDGAWQAYSD